MPQPHEIAPALTRLFAAACGMSAGTLYLPGTLVLMRVDEAETGAAQLFSTLSSTPERCCSALGFFAQTVTHVTAIQNSGSKA
jgi:hypothetical protein